MKIVIETIPHSDQRYDTVGDWSWRPEISIDEDILRIKVSDLGDWRYGALIAIHELVEALLCKWKGIEEEEVDNFDVSWHAPASNYEEPGDDPAAPYYGQHQFAAGIERTCAAALGVNWPAYELAVDEAGKLE